MTLDECNEGVARRPPAPALCLVLRCDALGEQPLWLSLADHEILEVTRGPASVEERREPDGRRARVVSIDDGHASRPHARLTRLGASVWIEDLGSKNGTLVDGRVVEREVLQDGALVEVGRSFFVFVAGSVDDQRDGRPRRFDAPGLPVLETASGALARTLDALARVAPSLAPVLLQGETGTGKEVLARRVHALSGRKGELVAVNCGALPAELAEAELFGVKKGAYTGAGADRVGLVRAAAGGTLFLDEIGDLPLRSQGALLRVLQERVVVPVGTVQPLAVDFRLVSATHRDLHAAVAAGEFRADLLARLSGVTLSLPPLRERREDLGILLGLFCARVGKPVTLSVRAARALARARWPGNVRALERAVDGALALAGDAGLGVTLDLAHFPDLADDEPQHLPAQTPELADGVDVALAAQLTELLREHHGNVSAVARVFGKKRMQVYRWIERCQLDPERFRPAPR